MIQLAEMWMLAVAVLVAGTYIAFILLSLGSAAAPASYLCAEVNGSLLVLTGYKTHTKVYVNGSLAWSGIEAYKWTVKVPLEGHVAEIKAVGGKNATFYALRLPNGTYVLFHDNIGKRLCI